MSYKDKIDPQRLPRHVAVIMDGNGRWAKSRGLDRSEGHVEGVNTVRKITEIASEIGIGYLTLYTFSTENWNRPQAEVDALMNLVVVAIERETADLIKQRASDDDRATSRACHGLPTPACASVSTTLPIVLG